jgi:hypothetical protein
MSTDTDLPIVTQLRKAVAARQDSLIQLRERIAALVRHIPVGTVLRDANGVEVCHIIRVCTGASSFGDGEWHVTIRGSAAVTQDGRLLAEHFATEAVLRGCDWYTRSSQPTCHIANGDPGDEVRYASGEVTRALAERLPQAIERYMAQCYSEVELNDASLA